MQAYALHCTLVQCGDVKINVKTCLNWPELRSAVAGYQAVCTPYGNHKCNKEMKYGMVKEWVRNNEGLGDPLHSGGSTDERQGTLKLKTFFSSYADTQKKPYVLCTEYFWHLRVFRQKWRIWTHLTCICRPVRISPWTLVSENWVKGLSCGIIWVILCLAVMIQYRSVIDRHMTTAYTALAWRRT